jgi:hypothetical protein
MKNVIWLLCGFFNLLIFAIIAFFYRPNLDTGLAIDSYNYMAASAMWIISPMFFYGFLVFKPSNTLKKSAYTLNSGATLLLLSVLAVSLFYFFFVKVEVVDYKSFWVSTAVQYFILIGLLLALYRTSEIADEITTNHELNSIRKSDLKSSVESMCDEILITSANHPTVKKNLDLLIEEIQFLPNQVPMNKYKEFNQELRELKSAGDEIFKDYSIALVDSETKINEYILKIKKAQKLLANYKNF